MEAQVVVDPAVVAILVVELDKVVADVDHLRLEVVALDPRGFLHWVALQHPTLSPLFLSTFSFGEKEEKEKSGLRQVIMMRTNDVGRISGEDSTFHFVSNNARMASGDLFSSDSSNNSWSCSHPFN